jgi:hypothetical protein
MRFSAVAALCAAPLALAGTLQADLVARGAVGIETSVSVDGSSTEFEGKDHSKSKSNGDNRDSGNNVVVEASGSTSITEVIIIWVNNGGGAPTSTVNAQSTFANAAPPGTAATHTVS